MRCLQAVALTAGVEDRLGKKLKRARADKAAAPDGLDGPYSRAGQSRGHGPPNLSMSGLNVANNGRSPVSDMWLPLRAIEDTCLTCLTCAYGPSCIVPTASTRSLLAPSHPGGLPLADMTPAPGMSHGMRCAGCGNDSDEEERGGRAAAFAAGRPAPRKHSQDWFQGNQQLQQAPSSGKKKRKKRKKSGPDI